MFRTVYLILVSVVGVWLPAAQGANYTFTTIDVPFPGTTQTIATGINDRGQIVGFYFTPGLITHGFVLSDGNFASFDAPTASCCTDFHAINDQGQIVGSSTGSSQGGGFLFAGGQFSTISVPGANSTGTNGINNTGQIVGTISISNELRGFLLNVGSVSFVQVPGAQFTDARGISDSGQVVGRADTHGFLFSNGVFSSVDFPGALNTTLQDINNKGSIVGWYQGLPPEMLQGFILDHQDFTTIDFPGSTFTQVFGINNAGQIVGSYGDFLRTSHGFLATPTIPEPSTWLLVAIGLLCLGIGWRQWSRPHSDAPRGRPRQ